MIRGIALSLLLAMPLAGNAYESDQFSNRLEDIADSTGALNEQVNLTIADIVERWRGPRKDMKFVNAVYHRIGGRHWVDKLERWAMKSPDVDRINTERWDSIYSGHPIYATRFAGLFGVGPTIKVDGVLIGSDKIGHFLSQGRKYYRRYQRYEDEARAARHSAYTERAIFGQMTTGSYSNADLVANYEGYRFYRSLFEDDIVPGKPAILRWEDQHWVIQRPYDWADHVNDFWDEALNVNHFDSWLRPHMEVKLRRFCDDYRSMPAMYRLENEQELTVKYAHLELRDTSDLRLDTLCEKPVPGSGQLTGMSEP